MLSGGETTEPEVTLVDESSGKAHIISEDGCLVLVVEKEDGRCVTSYQWFKEAVDAMFQLAVGPVTTPNADMLNRFTYHAPTGARQTRKYEAIRAAALRFATLIENLCPSSRERSLAWTKIEEAVFWANAAIARSPSLLDDPAPETPAQAPVSVHFD
jgi:hypothetical protein